MNHSPHETLSFQIHLERAGRKYAETKISILVRK